MAKEKTQITPEYYGLNNDLVFKYIYGTEDNKEYLVDLISEILCIKKDEFINSRITNSVKLDRETISKKGYEADIVLESEKIIFSVEMQNENTINTEIKNTMYGMKVFSNQLKKGDDYDKKTKPLIQICIVLQEKEEIRKMSFIKKYNIKSEEGDVILEDLYDIYVIDLKAKMYDNISRRLKGHLELISANTKEKYEKVRREYPELKEMMKRMEYFTEQDYVQDHIADDKLIRSDINLWKRKAGKAKKEGRQEGRKEGRKEGYTKGLTEANIIMAKKMIENNKDIKEICYYTNLPKKTIMSLREEKSEYNSKKIETNNKNK